MELVFATHNKNKAIEVEKLVGEQLKVLTLSDISIHEDVPETSATIEGNALQKAHYIFNNYKHNCFADDTGLEVEALNGEPGVYSARYAGEQKDANDNMAKLLLKLEGNNNRKARFKTVIALLIDGKEFLFEGIINGSIGLEKHGNKGFGYDPIFIPDGYTQTFAQMDMETKNRISHRAIAINKLVEFLKTANS